MAGPNPVAINIVVNAGSAQEAIAKMRAEIASLQGAGDAAGKGAAAAGEGIKGLKEQMGRGRETAMFFTQALGEFGPGGRTAQVAISGIAGAFLGGGGLLAVLSLAQVAVRVFTAQQAEMAAKAEEARKAVRDLADEASRLGISSQRSAQAAAQLIELRKQRAELDRQLAEAEAADDEDRAKRLREDIAKLTNDEIQIRLRIPGLIAQESEARAQASKRDAETKDAALEKERKAAEALAKDKADFETKMANAVFEREYENWEKLYAKVLADIDEAERRAKEIQEEIGEPDPDDLDEALGGGGKKGKDKNETAERIYEVKDAVEDLKKTGESFAGSFSASMALAFRPTLTSSKAFSAAMEEAGGAAQSTADLSSAAFAAIAQEALANLAMEAGSRAIFETAMGLATAATGNPAAAGHFAAAAMFAGVAGAAGGGAYAIGQNRGMTAAEKQQVENQRDSQSSGGGGSSFTSSGAGGTITKRETVIYIGNPLLSDAENARIAARTIGLANRLGYLRGVEG
jgi:hypothetical protein